jgi:hypothetical protein
MGNGMRQNLRRGSHRYTLLKNLRLATIWFPELVLVMTKLRQQHRLLTMVVLLLLILMALIVLPPLLMEPPDKRLLKSLKLPPEVLPPKPEQPLPPEALP